MSRMGVKGLYHYLCDRLESRGLQDTPIRGTLVIDGFNLAGTLYREGGYSPLEGGEYPAFYEAIRQYFQQLVDCGIEPIVVCDGPVGKGISEEEFERRRRERVDGIKKLKFNKIEDIKPPLFTRHVFFDAIESVVQGARPGNIRVFCADGDGDSEIAALANGYDCPVLSYDGDNFMFELRAGFVVGKFFRVEENGGSKAFGKVFFPLRSFSDGSIGLTLPNPDLRFIIPAIMGNDFLGCLDIGHKLTNIDEIVKIVHDHSIEDFPCDPDQKRKLIENYQKAKDYYKEVKDKTLEDASEQTSLQLPGKWALSCYRKGQFHKWMIQILMEQRCTLPITVEDMGKNTCHIASREIIQFIQGTLVGKTKIKQTVAIQEQTICLKQLDRQSWPKLQHLDKLSRDERMEIVCKVLVYDQQTLTTESKPEWQIVVAASSFWLRSIASKEKEDLARALVSCFIYCQRKCTHVRFPQVTERISSQLPLIHCFSQWQSVYYFTVMLNQLLLEPFQYTSPGRIFDGRKALYFAWLYKCERKSERSVFKNAEDRTLHDKLYRLITMSDEPQEATKRSRRPGRAKYNIATTNRFAGLQLMDD